MPYQVTVFNSWPSFASWDNLKNWLVSKEGGLLRVVEPPSSPYAIVRYVKGTSDFTLPHVLWCRSVVVHKDSRLPVSVSPPKALTMTEFTVNDAVIAEEFVDGTMLNVFHAANDESVCIATRSRLGADNGFYEGSVSFRDMLLESMANQGITTLSSILPTDGLHKFTSVVLQHSSNRIVKPVAKACFVVIHQGIVNGDGTVLIEESCTSAAPERYSIESIRAVRTVKDWVTMQSRDRGLGWQGVVLKDGTGRRWRERSDIYEAVRQLRGNESSIEMRYARLRVSKNTTQYLAFYGEETKQFYDLEGVLRKNTRNLFNFYVDTFRSRKTNFYELPWPYKHHVSVLHNYFKNTLRALNKKITLDEVIRYVNSLNNEDLSNMLKVHKLDLRPSSKPVAGSGDMEVEV
jgi:hypothetical protein